MLDNYNTHSTNKSIIVYKNSFYTVYVCPLDTIFHEDLLLNEEANLPKKKNQFFQSRRLLRTLLKDNNLNYQAKILKDEKGKPFLENTADNIHISITHTKNHVAVALSKDSPIGIDMETPKDRKYLTQIARKVFSDKEVKELDFCQDHTEYISIFFKYWTKRESLGKAYGIGLIFASNDQDFPENDHYIEWQYETSYILCVSILKSSYK